MAFGLRLLRQFMVYRSKPSSSKGAGGQRAELVAGAALIAAGLVAIGTAIGLTSAGLHRWFGSSTGHT